MRIVKLSEDIFSDLQNVNEFFEGDLRQRNPPGKFRITKGRIAENGLQPGEEVFFSYKGVVHYIAQSATGRLENNDEYQKTYPYYFLIDLTTLRPVKISLHSLEERYQRETSDIKSLVQSRGWPKIEDNAFVESLWESLTQE